MTFDGTRSSLPGCRFDEERFVGHRDPDWLILRRDWSTHGIACFYSEASHRLRGAVTWDDVPHYCDGSSSEQSAGEAPDASGDRGSGLPLLQACAPDAGVFDAAP